MKITKILMNFFLYKIFVKYKFYKFFQICYTFFLFEKFTFIFAKTMKPAIRK